ncbi:hypothetical protein FRX31_011732 [Thalictrum thalictroides]|uniref:Uncharacterized protein n=1 Tax=Thalictrum thalictroides TaxID=46969 RepID=A0A7J6WP12_THATH|nr:hypothetical protein FRX31_011732 [Thalictrum thalictroides]
MIGGNDDFSQFMKHKYVDKFGDFIAYHKANTIWPGIRNVLPDILDNSQWAIGTGEFIDFWRHNWLNRRSIKQVPHLNNADCRGLLDKVSAL